VQKGAIGAEYQKSPWDGKGASMSPPAAQQPDVDAMIALARSDEREQIAQMIEGAPPLMPFAQNDQGGCLMCGFTPKLAAATIRARENT
jgi:hypothetical protein